MVITWQAADGTPQEIDLKKVLAVEQSRFIEYVDKLPPMPSRYQASKAADMLKSIEQLKQLIKGVANV